MSLRDGETEKDHADGAQRARASALTNPTSGLANDFLNVYNEILMLIEMVPAMPELADDIFAWRPCSYRSYFMQSDLPGSAETLDAYARLDPSFRTLFETSVELLAECSVQAIRAIERTIALGGTEHNDHLATICADWCANLRKQLEATEQLINWGRITRRRSRQAVVDRLFSAA